jgi:Flp pilus assembly protein TadG
MAGITLAQAEAQLTAWLAADSAVAGGQAYSIAGRSLTRANAKEITAKIEFWDQKVKTLSRGGRAIKGVTPC